MALKIITNNQKVIKYCEDKSLKVLYIQGNARDVLIHTRMLLLNNNKLAADPLGGYLSRPNPYHTIFLQDSTDNENIYKELIRIERGINQWYRYSNIIEMNDTLDNQYEVLDYSIAVNTLQGLLRTPMYYSCI